MAQQTDPNLKHSLGLLIKKFCTQRMDKCDPCENKYADIVSTVPDLAVSFKFPRLKTEDGVTQKQEISQNAHHVLCVAEVTKIISKDAALKAVLENTVWCINASLNMMALPLFAHTVYWYLKFKGAGPRTKVGKFMTAGAPPFENLPNHDIDHGKYNGEVEEELGRINGRVKEAEHSLQPGKLVKELDDLSVHLKKQLTHRGRRGKMTHQTWLDACDGKIDKWYEPFSLAKSPEERGFPDKVEKNSDRLDKAINFLTNR